MEVYVPTNGPRWKDELVLDAERLAMLEVDDIGSEKSHDNSKTVQNQPFETHMEDDGICLRLLIALVFDILWEARAH